MTTTMDVLLTGASGFVGTALLPRLASGNHRVTAISRTPIQPIPNIEVMNLDLRDREATIRALTPWRWNAVVHLAGPVPKGADPSWEAQAETIAGHVRFVTHLGAVIPTDWQGRFVHVSSCVVYGNPTTEPVLEDHPRRPLHAYALAKSLAEDVLIGSHLRDRWILRVGGLFSESRKYGALFNFIRASKAGEPLRIAMPTPVPWEILHVDDAVTAIMRSLTATARDPGPLNAGYGEPIHIKNIAERIARRSTRGSTVTLEGASPPVFHADIAKARELIDWPPRTLDSRLDDLWASVESVESGEGQAKP